MTYIGIYSSEKGLAAITDSQATAGENKWDNCQKLYTVGGNLLTGTGLAAAIKETAKRLDEIIGGKIIAPAETAKIALDEGMQTFDFRQEWARTHLHISGAEKGLGKKSAFKIYAVVLSNRPGVYDAGRVVFDGSGSLSVVQALERDMQNGLNITVYKDLDNILAFLYDTGIEAPESPGVNMEFQFGFTDSNNIAAVYHPNVVVEIPAKKRAGKKLKQSFSKAENDAVFAELYEVLRQRYIMRQRYTEAFNAGAYGRKGKDAIEILKKKDLLREKTIGLISRMLDTRPNLLHSKKPEAAEALPFVKSNYSETLYCYRQLKQLKAA